ncbi:hypothetical protein GCM10023082_01370 [Streptomyces tremellae]|uniref:Transposase n=1 Tax=Streptomyces tremellae TaxID=1124239 RepID=A0ABP7DKX1_9ACTN
MTYTDEFLNTLRTVGDELADATVATLFERGEVGRGGAVQHTDALRHHRRRRRVA